MNTFCGVNTFFLFTLVRLIAHKLRTAVLEHRHEQSTLYVFNFRIHIALLQALTWLLVLAQA
jgi:hypothetical protein